MVLLLLRVQAVLVLLQLRLLLQKHLLLLQLLLLGGERRRSRERREVLVVHGAGQLTKTRGLGRDFAHERAREQPAAKRRNPHRVTSVSALPSSNLHGESENPSRAGYTAPWRSSFVRVASHLLSRASLHRLFEGSEGDRSLERSREAAQLHFLATRRLPGNKLPDGRRLRGLCYSTGLLRSTTYDYVVIL